MSEMKNVMILTYGEENEFAARVADMLAEKGIAYTTSSEECANAVLAVLDAKETVNVKVAAKVLEYIGRGIPVFSICPECECCACGETVEMLAKLFAAEAEPEIEIEIIEEPIIEEPVIEEPIIEEPIIEEPVIEEPVIEEPVIEEPVIEEPIIEEPVIEEPTIEEPVFEEATVNLESMKSGSFCECGAEIDPTMAFCWGCGKRIVAPVVEENVAEEIAVEETVAEPAKCACGAEILPDTLFCWSCGKRVEKTEPEAPKAPEAKKCVCGADIAEGTLFCWQCGKRVGESALETPAVPVTPKCPTCGADVSSGDKFCFSCGTPL